MARAEEFDEEFRHLVGEKVECISKGEQFVGILQYAGTNKVIHDYFQVTLNRMPIWPADRDSLKLYEGR